MRKAVGVFAATALIIALIAMWMRLGLVATESVTAAEVRPLSSAISPFELMLKNGKSLPDAYHGADYTHVYRNR